MNTITPSTQAILLMTSYFSENRVEDVIPLNVQEWGNFAQWLHEHDLKPEDLLRGDIEELLKEWNDENITITRLKKLLHRGGALALAMEKWQRVGIWVITRSSSLYPQQLKKKLKSFSPPLFYGIGNPKLLNKQSIGFLGSEENLQDSHHLSFELGSKVANDGYTLVTSDIQELGKSAIKGALEKEGTVTIFIANNLLQASLNSQYRKALMSNDLVLVSAYHPESLANTMHSLENSKYIEAQAISMLKIDAQIKNSNNFVENKILNKDSIQLSLFDDNSKNNSIKEEVLTDLFFNFFVSQLRLQFTLNDIFKPKELEKVFNLKLSQINSWIEEAEDKNIIKRLKGRVKKYQLLKFKKEKK